MTRRTRDVPRARLCLARHRARSHALRGSRLAEGQRPGCRHQPRRPLRAGGAPGRPIRVLRQRRRDAADQCQRRARQPRGGPEGALGRDEPREGRPHRRRPVAGAGGLQPRLSRERSVTGLQLRRLGSADRKTSPPTVYAHVATQADAPGKLSLQYWFFYLFNDWNNKHEGDWEMVQLNFHANTAEQALQAPPYEVGYSQHESAERATWGASKLQIVDGTHPVVYPSLGRTPTTTPRACIWVEARPKAWDATTRLAPHRPSGLTSSWFRRPTTSASSPGRHTSADGVSVSKPSTTGRPVPMTRAGGRRRSRGPTRRVAKQQLRDS